MILFAWLCCRGDKLSRKYSNPLATLTHRTNKWTGNHIQTIMYYVRLVSSYLDDHTGWWAFRRGSHSGSCPSCVWHRVPFHRHIFSLFTCRAKMTAPLAFAKISDSSAIILIVTRPLACRLVRHRPAGARQIFLPLTDVALSVSTHTKPNTRTGLYTKRIRKAN